jgi:hypothetical protein
VEVVCADGGGPDAADMVMAMDMMGFAHAAASGGAGTADITPPPPFVTPRALAALAALSATGHDAAAAARTAAWNAAASAAEFPAAAAFATGAATPAAPAAPAAVLVVTTDNDLALAMDYAATQCGCGVVVCGDVVPGVHRRRRVEARTKKVRKNIAADRAASVVGPRRNCSPRHRVLANSINEGSNAFSDVGGKW